jgi:hypothetical protein
MERTGSQAVHKRVFRLIVWSVKSVWAQDVNGSFELGRVRFLAWGTLEIDGR